MLLDIPENLIVKVAAEHLAANPDFENKVAKETARMRAERLWIYTVSDAARELRCSRGTVGKWRKDGLIEFRNGKTCLSEILSVTERLERIEPKQPKRVVKPVVEQPRRRLKI